MENGGIEWKIYWCSKIEDEKKTWRKDRRAILQKYDPNILSIMMTFYDKDFYDPCLFPFYGRIERQELISVYFINFLHDHT